MGGTVSYSAVTASALGFRTGIVTGASDACDLTAVEAHALVVRRPCRETTTFENRYRDGRREQMAYAVAPPLEAAYLPPSWRKPTVAHIGPIMGECRLDLLDAFAPSTFLGVTPQGWLRVRDASGRVHPAPWKRADAWLPGVSAVVLSLDDVGQNWSLVDAYAQQTDLLVVTQGWLGGVLFQAGQSSSFSAPSVREVDPTGAGDIFSTCFFAKAAVGTDPEVAVRFASCVAARSVTRVGLAARPTAEEIQTCERIWDC